MRVPDEMPLSQVVAEAWGELGPAVGPLGWPTPTKRTWSTLFRMIFRDVRREGSNQALFKQKSSHEPVGSRTAEAVRQILLAHAETLTRTARWKAALDTERKRRRLANRDEAILREAWRLAQEVREPDAGTVAEVVRVTLRADRRRPPLRDYLADSDVRAGLTRRIEHRWAQRDWPGPGPSAQERERIRRLVELARRRLAPGTTLAGAADATEAEADAVFAGAIAAGDGTLARYLMARAGDVGLASTSPPPVPVVGTFVRNRRLPPPLDRSIAARLGKWDEKNPDVPDEWPAFVDAEVDRATSPLGLAAPSSQMLLCAAVFIAAAMDLDPASPRTPGVAGQLEAAALAMPSVKWAVRKSQAAAIDAAPAADAASGATGPDAADTLAAAQDALTALLELPEEWVARRLWPGLARAEREGRPITSRAEFADLLWRSWEQATRDYAERRGAERSGRDTQAWRSARITQFLARAGQAGLLEPQLLELLEDPFADDGGMRRELRDAWARLRTALGEEGAPTARDAVLWLRANRRA
ncbi:hypothetical protein [Blastococcus sp. SYSU DS1021]